MSFRLGPWTVATALIAICVAIVGGAWYLRSGSNAAPDRLLAHVPPQAEAVIAIDVARLRDAGILDRIAGPQSSEEADYRSFADVTEFEYRRDLDYVIVAIAKRDIWCVAKGRYDWPALMHYAELQQGTCAMGMCRLPSAEGGRRISYFPLRRNVLALGLGGDEWLVTQLQGVKTRAWQPPASPLWVRIEKPLLNGSRPVPEGLRPALALLQGANDALLTVEQRDLALEARIEIGCPNTQEAARIRTALTAAVNEIGRLWPTDPAKANRPTIPGLLSRGQFSVQGTRVVGSWGVDESFLSAIAGGN